MVTINLLHCNKWIQRSYSQFRKVDAKVIGRQHTPTSLIDEAVIAIGILIMVFLLSKQQGLSDARRDAVEQTSLLPVVSLILSQDDGVLAQDLRLLEDNGNAISDLPLLNHALIGDLDLAREIRSTSLSNNNQQQVWRLLAQESEGWLYLLRTMPKTATSAERPLVLALPNAKEGQALIISPNSPRINR